MRASSPQFRERNSESKRSIVEHSEQSFGEVASVISQVARTLWPRKTAVHVAAASNCSVRAAEMYLGGQREWSGDAIAAIVAEIMRRHGMRNVKVVKRQ
jgi:hypothetical protein